MQSVIITRQVRDKINLLFITLLEEGYFSYTDNADDYCNKIEAFIEVLPTQKHFLTKNKVWGAYYATYKANRRTTWYITFDKVEDRGYLVQNIFNNHTKEYPFFIAG